jgi:hypothetical protein
MSMFRGLKKVQDFFGAELKDVDIRLRNIVMLGHRPEWLRNCPRLYNLPRNGKFEDGVGFRIAELSPDDLSARIIWVVDTLDSDWYLGKKNLYLKTDADIVYYRLRWPEKLKKSS